MNNVSYRPPQKDALSKLGETIAAVFGLLLFAACVCFMGWIGYEIYKDITEHKQQPKERYYSPPDFKEWKPAEPPPSTGRY